MIIRLITILVYVGVLTGCDMGPVADAPNYIAPSAANIERAQTLLPTDADLARIYTRSCRNCHAVFGVGAPLTGHGAAWAPRLEARGRTGLLMSTRAGYRFMPAGGLCPNCSDDEYLALIDFMAGTSD